MRRFKYLIPILFMAVVFVFPNTSHASGTTSTRLGGQDRFEVAVNVANTGWQTSNTVVLANYLAPFDALTATPLAYYLQAPILLTQADVLTPTTKNEIVKLQAKKVVIVGGESSVTKNVVAELTAMGIQEVDRISGEDRFEVAKNVAAELPDKQNAIVANGYVFADSLSIAPYAASKGYPILLTQPNKIPDITKEALNGRTQVTVVGGTGSVSDSVYSSVGGDQRIGGHDRFEVATNIVKQLNLPTNKVYLASGMTFADALTGSVLAAKDGAPLLLVQPTILPSVVKTLIENKGINNFEILGGPASVSGNVISLIGKKIVLDAGHGGYDPGAIAYDGTHEADLNYSFTTILAEKLKNYGADVILTRTGNNYLSLAQRADFANSQNPDLFISIHHNIAAGGVYYSTYRPGLDQSGVIVTFDRTYPYSNSYPWIREDTANHRFVYNDHGVTKSASYDCSSCTVAWAFDTTPSPAATISQDLATKVSNAMVTSSIKNDGIHNQDLYVTRWTNMPSILIELGNIKSSSELRLLENTSIKNTRAVNIANAIADELN